jgi:hypothetical protein
MTMASHIAGASGREDESYWGSTIISLGDSPWKMDRLSTSHIINERRTRVAKGVELSK